MIIFILFERIGYNSSDIKIWNMGWFNKMANQRIIAITFIHDYFQITFENEMSFNINNTYTIEGIIDFRELIYKTVVTTEFTDEKFIIILSGDSSIIVGIAENDYTGPEAMQLCIPNGPDVIHRWGD